MSTETKHIESPATNGEVSTEVKSIPAPSSPTRHGSWFSIFNRRRNQVIAVVALMAVVSTVLGYNFVARQYTPDGAVRQYLGALQSGDATGAWSQLQVSPPSRSVAASLVSQYAL